MYLFGNMKIFSKSLGRKKYFFKEEAEKIDFLKCDKLRV